MSAYYNENDPEKAAWLRELIRQNVVAPGEVDERSIAEVGASDLRGFAQCHFFAGIGGWSYALRLAGWPDDRRCWTGSCPCQSLSCAGLRKGHADKRHLWPAFYRLIAERNPAIVLGEQVASLDGREWFAGVRADLEAIGYACGGASLCAASVGAPHIRNRLYWVANSNEYREKRTGAEEFQPHANCQAIDGMAKPTGESLGRSGQSRIQSSPTATRLADANGYHGHWWSGPLQVGRNAIEAEVERSGRKFRAQWRIKPGLPLLAHGVSGRVGRLRGYGDAIVPQVAQAFIEAYIEAERLSP